MSRRPPELTVGREPDVDPEDCGHDGRHRRINGMYVCAHCGGFIGGVEER